MTTDQDVVQAHRTAKRKGNGRPAKLTEQELASRAQARITAAHAQPRYDLSIEPWLPVLRDGQVVTVGLRELLADAAVISDVALPNALLRASVRRWLHALTADLVRRDRSRTAEDWEDAHEANSGFTNKQINALLDVHGQHLWLWHPSTPFLQDPRLTTISTKPHADLPVQDLVLHLPSGSSAAWWIKAGEPALQGASALPRRRCGYSRAGSTPLTATAVTSNYQPAARSAPRPAGPTPRPSPSSPMPSGSTAPACSAHCCAGSLTL